MTAEEIQECDAREQVTCSKSHTKNTKTTYMSYWNALRDWAALHIRACLDADGNFDVHRLREWIQNNLEQARTMFIRFLSQRKHRYKRYPDGRKKPVGEGTLRGFCSAMSYHVWGKHGKTQLFDV